MFQKSVDTIPFCFFEQLSGYNNLVHFISTKHGPAGEGTRFAFNLSLRVNDHPANVQQNKKAIASAFGIEENSMIFAGQTHDDKVAVINSSILHMTEDQRNNLLYGYDAMVTGAKNICLCILTADCASVLLYDPVKNAIGIAHAGWKGTVKKIAAETISAMSENFGSNPGHLLAAVGPCICADSFEVGEEVARIFEAEFPLQEGIILRKPEWPKPHIDIVAANVFTLKESGVRPENIETSGICTFQNDELFFSARKQAQGRFGAGIMMR